MRLFKVILKFETLVIAEDELEAEYEALHEIKNTGPEEVFAEEIITYSDVPISWRGCSIDKNNTPEKYFGLKPE